MTKVAETRSQRSSAEIPKETGIPLLIRVRARRHVTRAASAAEIRKALGVSQKDLDAARRDLALLGLKNKHP